MLQSYVNDLSEQNEVLVSTVEELEREANDRVALLEEKLQKASISVKVRILYNLWIYRMHQGLC